MEEAPCRIIDAILEGSAGGRTEEELIRRISTLLAAGADVNERNGQDATPLIFAVSGQLPGVMRFLLDRGADLRAKNSLGQDAVDMMKFYRTPATEAVLAAALAAERQEGTRHETAAARQQSLRKTAPRLNLGGRP